MMTKLQAYDATAFFDGTVLHYLSSEYLHVKLLLRINLRLVFGIQNKGITLTSDNVLPVLDRSCYRLASSVLP
jgi:hypothetical protein